MSIKVAIRARPFNEKEATSKAECVLRMNGPIVEVLEDGQDAAATHQFAFDHAFWSVNAVVPGNKNLLAGQKTVYEQVGLPVVDHVLQGYNACLFAYGQTGAGKTYSMMGDDGDNKGIIPRFANSIFQEVGKAQKLGTKMCVELSFFEIYCEKVRCLLNPSEDGSFASLKVREHPTTGPYVDGLAKMAVKNEAGFLKLLNEGSSMRITAETSMNAQSSRSHAVCTVFVSQKTVDGAVTRSKISKLNLVDLAGSERADKTGAKGTRLAEGSKINQSLSSLGLVISGLSESMETGKKAYIPYRDSILTWILKDNLGGNSQTVMLAAVSPALDQIEETLSTLRYAERAKKIVNKAVVNESNDNQMIGSLQDQIAQLRTQIAATSSQDNKKELQEILKENESAMADMKLSFTEKLVDAEALMSTREQHVQKLLAEKEETLTRMNSELGHAKDDLNSKDAQIRKLRAKLQAQERKASAAAKEEAEADKLRGQLEKLESGPNRAKKGEKKAALVREGDMGNIKVAGQVTVRALAKAYENQKSPTRKKTDYQLSHEDSLLVELGVAKKIKAQHKAKAAAAAAAGGGDDDEDMDLDDLGDDELELDEEDELELDDEDDEEEEMELLLDDDDLELDDDDLELDDEDELELDDDEDGVGESAAVGDDEMELDMDDEMELDMDEDEDDAAPKQEGMGIDESALMDDDDEMELDTGDLDEEEEAQPASNDSVSPPKAQHADPNASSGAPAAQPAPAAQRSRGMTVAGGALAANTGGVANPGYKEAPKAPAPTPGKIIKSNTSAISTLVVPSHALPNNRFLREPFKVVKVDEGAILSKTKDRVWDVDFFGKKFNNMDLSGYISFTMSSSHLFRVEKSWTNDKKLTLYFFDAPHPYDLILSSVERRWRMFELATLQRRNSIMWCPSLCPDEDNDAVIQVMGTTIDRSNGRSLKVKGDGKFMVARMPYEVIDFWFGCFNLQSRPLPNNTASLSNFIPKGTNEVYVIGVADVPGSLMGQTTLGDFFLAYLGPSYFVLKNTCVDSKDKPKKGNNAMVVIVRRSFIVRMSHADGVELGSIKKVDTNKGDFSAVAVTMQVNESTVCCILVNATPFMDDNALRSANLRALISSLPLGNTNIDISNRFDYLMVGGSFGYMNPFTKDDVLVQQMRAGSIMCEFHEGKATQNMSGMMNPMRVMYHVRPKNCRMDVKKYDADPHLKLPNIGVSADIFTQRAFLSTFGEQVPSTQFIISNFSIKPTRMPSISGMELHIYAPWLDGSPLINPLTRQGDFLVPTGTMTPLRPCVHNHEFLRLQSIGFSLMGVVANQKDKKKGVVASGNLSLKNNFALGETMEFTFNMMYRTCIVGSVTASLLQVNVGDHAPRAKAGGAATAGGGGGSGVSTSHTLTVQCDENQILDQQGCWCPSMYPEGPWDWSDFRNPGVQCRRESHTLPGKDWSWIQEWRHDSKDGNKEGWAFASNFVRCDFTGKQNDTHHARRRRWTRVMQAPDAVALHNYVSSLN